MRPSVAFGGTVTGTLAIEPGLAYAGFSGGYSSNAMVAAFDAKGVKGCRGAPPTCQCV